MDDLAAVSYCLPEKNRAFVDNGTIDRPKILADEADVGVPARLLLVGDQNGR
ncbi:MAG: hypothetical protein H6846_00180 [Hyphomonas sp.]|nr:hypothetical protein [Hyphomonas sp.]